MAKKVLCFCPIIFRRHKMKKALVVTALVVGMGLVGWQQASANWGMGGGFHGMGGGCLKGGPGYSQLDAATKAKVDKFYDETKDLRKQMVMKHAEEAALMSAATPDAAKVSKLAGDIFDLRTTIQTKAEAAGVPGLVDCGGHPGMRQGMGRGMGQGMGPGMGQGMGPGMMNAGPHNMGPASGNGPAGSDAQ
jgi:Spy/CpxP family protein refolding chaperone